MSEEDSARKPADILLVKDNPGDVRLIEDGEIAGIVPYPTCLSSVAPPPAILGDFKYAHWNADKLGW